MKNRPVKKYPVDKQPVRPWLSFDCQYRYAAGFTLQARFETDQGLTALVGPSGSGKTTILSLLAGLLQPSHGTIRLGDDTWTDTRTAVYRPPEDRRVGLLFQQSCLFPHLRVQGNIEYGSRRRPAGRVDIQQVIETLELPELLHRFPRELSGGQQQRVALARALASQPQLLLLDEPFTGVESRLKDQIARLLQQVVEELQIPTLLVSHDRHLVERIAHRVLYLQEGRVTPTAHTDPLP